MHFARTVHASRNGLTISAPPLPGARPGIFARLAGHPSGAPAVTHGGRTETYGDLLRSTAATAAHLRSHALPPSDGAGARVGLLLWGGHAWVRSLLGVWGAGLVAVPLSRAYPLRALAPLLADAGAGAAVAPPGLALPKGVRALPPPAAGAAAPAPGALLQDAPESAARMLLYTSGTTGRPKGVVWTDGMLRATLAALHAEWRWCAADRALCVLPLHHVHGVVNVALGALYAGAELVFHDRFDAAQVWGAVCGPSPPSVVMAVPTVYARLIDHYLAAGRPRQGEMREAARRVRLFVCGSAALPRQTADRWAEIAGAIPLERYGMTETGMLLSNAYEKVARVPSALGAPFPGVSARVQDAGRLLVKGPSVFTQYWRNPLATKKSFDDDGWFHTGDVVQYDKEESVFRMLGRESVDIIKTGGYKVSALEVEAAVRDVDGVGDIAVLGVPHGDLGEAVIAVVVCGHGAAEHETRERILAEVAAMLPRYKIPRAVHFVEQFSRSAMGKVQKGAMKKEWANWYSERGWERRTSGG